MKARDLERLLKAFVDEISCARNLEGEVQMAVWRVAGLRLIRDWQSAAVSSAAPKHKAKKARRA
jgi:hypothetical protein